MKTIVLGLFLISLNAFGASKLIETTSTDRLNNRIEKRVGDVAFELELMYPDEETAWFIAYKECGDVEPLAFIPRMDFGEDPSLVPCGYKTKNYYDSGIGKDIIIYKCKERTNDERRTAKISPR